MDAAGEVLPDSPDLAEEAAGAQPALLLPPTLFWVKLAGPITFCSIG